ncbi:MAG: GxxExxY protein [Halofilum sp. (in: g-proteobacteria)]|nr:GxxExxY protein [Halofilum sp. (in: g-proteobacteria)]
MKDDEIGRLVVDAAVAVHRELGPGLLEKVYEAVLVQELRDRGVGVERQVSCPATLSRHSNFDEGFRIDIWVQSQVLIEVKCVERLDNAHRKQLLTYLRLTGMKLGFLFNFGEPLMKNGIVRVANGAEERP